MARRTGILLLAIVLLSSLVACGAQPAAEAPTAQNGASAATAAPAATMAPAAPAMEARESPAEGAASGVSGAPPPDVAAPAADAGSAAIGGGESSAGAPLPAPAAPAAPAATGSGAAGDPRRPSAPEASLKAGEIDDNAAFADYLAYLAGYQWRDVRLADVRERYLIRVIDDAQRPVLDARVTVYDGERAVFSGRTYAGGETIFMPGLYDAANTDSFRVVAEYGQARAETTLARGASEQVELGLRGATPDETLRLDLLFLLDTTGSMGDELAYIQAEIGNIASGIKLAYPQLVPRFGLVSYRDDGDMYVARSTDFTADLGAFRQALNAESAGGGGDIPEAADDGLHAATALSWRSGAVARVAFWVADAPHHTQDTASMTTAIESAMEKGVHVYPIGASGVEERAEFTMRTAAQMSGGRYLFLTDDSGIGNSHAEPHIPCYYVTTLKDAVARMMRVELSGEHVRPGEAEILRSVGAPKDGICTLRDGQTTAKAF